MIANNKRYSTKLNSNSKIIGRALQNTWKKNGAPEELELIVTGTQRSRDMINEIIKGNAEKIRLYENAGIISFKAEYSFANMMLEAWLGENNRLNKSYRNTFSSITGIEPSMQLEHYIRNASKRTSLFGMPKRKDMWNLTMIGAYDAHEYSEGKNATVAVIDTGADFNHEEIKHAFGRLKGINIVTGSDNPHDVHGHGTHVTGTIVGKNTGVAPKATVYAVQVFDGEYATTSDVIAGIDWSINQKADVISMSLGGPTPSPAMQDIINVAAKNGIYVVAAAGNEGRGPSYPASCENTIAVAAVDHNKKHAYFSNIYHTNDISAPGVDIFSCVPGGYNNYSGTSMATPHVSGVLALLQSIKKRNDYESIMKESAEVLEQVRGENYEEVYGSGLVRVDEAISYPANVARSVNTIKEVAKRIWKVIY